MFCFLEDIPGAKYVKVESNLDLAVWLMPLQEETPTRWVDVLSQPLMGAVSSTGTSTIALVCDDSSTSSPGVKVLAAAPVIHAIQTSHNE